MVGAEIRFSLALAIAYSGWTRELVTFYHIGTGVIQRTSGFMLNIPTQPRFTVSLGCY